MGRLVEAHSDAVAINRELGGPDVGTGQRWGVWAAGSPTNVQATANGERWVLNGVKPWCSGATLLTHALVTAGDRLFAVEVSAAGCLPGEPSWVGTGMVGTDTRSVDFDRTPAQLVGSVNDYLTRPGFWMGAIGVAACWHGGAARVGSTLLAQARTSEDPHLLAHLGAAHARLDAGAAVLRDAARRIDADPAGDHKVLARSVRNSIERGSMEIVDRCGRALGPAPLARDAHHSTLVSDLMVYVRQHHAERDLELLSRDLITENPTWLP